MSCKTSPCPQKVMLASYRPGLTLTTSALSAPTARFNPHTLACAASELVRLYQCLDEVQAVIHRQFFRPDSAEKLKFSLSAGTCSSTNLLGGENFDQKLCCAMARSWPDVQRERRVFGVGGVVGAPAGRVRGPLLGDLLMIGLGRLHEVYWRN